MIPCAITAEFQAGTFDLRSEPLASSEMRLAESGAVHSAIPCRAERCQLVERIKHPVGVDAQRLMVR